MLEANFISGYETVTVQGLTQWDKGQKLQITGLASLPATFQVHFANTALDEAIVMLGSTVAGVGTVDIPNSLLESELDFKAWIYVIDAEGSETIKTILFPLTERTKPADFISEPNQTEQILLEQTMTNVNAATANMQSQINSTNAQVALKANQSDLLTEITNRTSAVATEKSERLAEVAVERARINSFTALTAGSTTGDAELIDGRIGANAKTYTNIGENIRDIANGSGISKKAITQDNLAFCSANRQFFNINKLISNKAYSGAGTTTTPGDSRYQIMPSFSIDANKSYYYYKVQGTLSFIKWNDGTVQQFSTTYGDASGKITTTQAGIVYITAFTPSGSPATIFSDALLPYYISVPPALNFNVKNNDEYINVDLIKHIGLRNIVNGYGGEAYNGGTINGNVMSIPSGSTGNNTYISIPLDKEKVPYQVGDEILYSITYTITGDSLNSNYQTPINIFVNENTGRFDKFFPYRIVNGNTIKHYSKITIPGGVTGTGLRIALQFLNTVALSTATTITINEVNILSKATRGYYENQINSLILYYPKMTHLIVDINGTGDFTSLRACLESITDSSKTKPYTVYIKPGQYIMENEYVNPWGDPYFKGLFVPNHVKLIGVGNREDVRICATSTQGSAYPSALNIQAYAEMENITVDANGMRYCIHDDFDEIRDGAYQKFKNCHFIGENNVYGATFGSGCRNGATWEFENCIFENKNNGVAFTNHNNIGWTKPAHITFDNCRFITALGTYSIRFSTLNTNANKILTYITLKGCKLTGANVGFQLEEESASVYGAGILFKVSGYANIGASYLIINTDGKDYSSNIDLI